MVDYRGMYHSLFNDVTNAINLLQRAQQKTEEIYIAGGDAPIKLGDGAESEEETDSE